MRTRTPTVHLVADDAPPVPLLLHRSENPWGASPKAVEAARAELLRVHRYPDPQHTALIDALSSHHRVTTDRVAVGNGVDEIIMMLALASRDLGRAVINEATYQGYVKSLTAVGLRVAQVPLEDHRVGPAALVEEMHKGPALVFVCNPHNPAGTVLDADAVRSLCETARATGSHLVLDEAYAEFVGTTLIGLRDEYPNLIVVRTASKAYALAGLRVGFAVARPEVIARMNPFRPPGSISTVSVTLVTEALRDDSILDTNLARVETERTRLTEALRALGW